MNVVFAKVKTSPIYAYFLMARPDQLGAVTLMYLTGVVMAQASGASISATVLIWGFVALIPVAISIHYANEYADYETDALTQPTLFSGGSGALLSGSITRQSALYGAWLWLMIGVTIAVLGLLSGVITIAAFAVLLLGAFGGWMYSLPPLQLAWRGWGEIDNAFLGGMMLPLYGYSLVTGTIDLWIIFASLPFTLLVFNNLLATTWADRKADATVGKNTLATKHPPALLRKLYTIVALVAGMSLLLLSQNVIPREVVLGSLVVIPLQIWGIRTYTHIHSPHPTVLTMIAMMIVQLTGWIAVV